ncbi:hypothetical protein [Microvirga lotononidis]|uniref:Uncharacterized protein n=1 Tax=Microvirga lotononidis TaxID=864069 RepID=I4YUM6_9HYPH|nr:hypothetical protein [Microvirga lotononidis]EIM27668.1 hypothetical protein MicloDRAFT_00042390 [Microvirga lotononidis]WQO28193.1 hypothetical protein U0023_03560 [Microvirga lotononidis]
MSLTRSGAEWKVGTNSLYFGTTLTNGNVLFLGVQTNFGGDKELIGQAVSPAGVPVGSSFVLQSIGTGEIAGPVATPLANGRFAIAWQRLIRGPDNNSTSDDIAVLETGIFNSDGSVYKAPVQVGSSNAHDPMITSLANGGYALSYDDGGTRSIAFDRSGTPGAVATISPAQTYAPAGLRGGGYVTVVTGLAASGSETEIKAYLRHPNGTMTETLIKKLPGNDIYPGAQVVGLTDGNFVVAWRVANADGSQAIKAQVVSSQGTLIGT